MVGTPKKRVTGWRSSRSKTWSGEKSRHTIEAPPIASSGAVSTLRPPVWNSGALRIATSSGRRPQPAAVPRAFQAMLPWVSTAARARPVVPPV